LTDEIRSAICFASSLKNFEKHFGLVMDSPAFVARIME
jgi:hypothetical protein